MVVRGLAMSNANRPCVACPLGGFGTIGDAGSFQGGLDLLGLDPRSTFLVMPEL
jgi:hypothetical protein